MAKWGFIGAAVGAAVGIGLAPFTGGASLGLLAAGGALTGATIGNQIDTTNNAKKASKELLNDQRARDAESQKRLKEEKTRADSQLAKEKSKVDAGIARAMRRKFRSPGGFLESGGTTSSTGVLG